MVLGVWSSLSLLKYSFIASVLLASMYASHTLIAYPIISRYGLSRQRIVSITIGGTAVTVILALTVLAIIGGMYKDNSLGGWFWLILLLKVSILFSVIIFFMPRVVRWFFRRYDDSVMQFVFVLSMVFLGAGLMEFVGIEGILGAFLAGLVINRFIPPVSPLMNRIEFLGNALFIPYFLIGVGMIIDLRCLFTNGQALKVALIMTVVATFSKWLSAYLTKKIYNLHKVEYELMFGLSNAQAAATLAAVLIGHNIILGNGERLLNDDVLNGTVVMILFTCIISSIVTEKAAKKMVVQYNPMTNVKDKEHYMISVSNPETIENLVQIALMVKSTRNREDLVGLSVINDSNSSEVKELQGRRLLEHAAMLTAAADQKMETVLRYDLNIAQGIIHTVREHNITDIVIGLHKKSSLVDSFFGTLTESLLNGTRREVIISKLTMPVNTLRRIVVFAPDKSEYELGFAKWVKQICRMALQLGCHVQFFTTVRTLDNIRKIVIKREAETYCEFIEIDNSDDLQVLSTHVNYDHLLVVISSRKGSISYMSSFDKLPAQISKYFSNCSLMMIYPDQNGEAQEVLTFSDPLWQQNKPNVYDNVGKWIYKWFRKDDEFN